ncbi:MAG: NTP transferase domain-containing protein [Bacteroidetes bacterium]|nr:NTP transferase domain-containing protein [Bacteroidota bacterium]
MRIIIPMAGMGKRMRPHTLVTPKPLVEFAGKPMVHHIVEELAGTCNEPIEEIAFIIGNFGKKVEDELVAVAEQVGARGKIYYQDEPLGTAHAVLCAADSLDGKLIVAFADTLFKADFVLDEEKDSVIWVQQVDDPRAFGVVKLNTEGLITDFVEKPQEFVSDLAIIGIYYFRDGQNLKKELQYLIDNNIKEKGEFQLTNALENMKSKGLSFVPGKVIEWLDCGNKNATVYTHARWLDLGKEKFKLPSGLKRENSTIVEPCYIGKDVEITGSVVGPFVSVADGTVIRNSVIRNSIIQKNTSIENSVIGNSMIGNSVVISNKMQDLSVGDYSVMTSGEE